MTRVETIGAATLYLGDCLEILPTLCKVDAVITDPPYGMDLGGISGGVKDRFRRSGGLGADYTIIGDDAPFDPAPILLAAGDAKIVLWGANHYASRLPDNRKWIVWDKRAGGTPDNQADCEMAWTNLDGPERMHVQLWRGMIRSGEENVSTGSYRNHPAQKPVALMDACIRHCGVTAGATILDPYMGTGACGVAAVRRGLRYIGVEKHEPYFVLACRRIEEAYKQPRLFAEPAPKPQQVELL